MPEKVLQLANGVEGLFIKNNRFNTTLISYNFYLPLKKETVAAYGLLPFILTSCSKKYPDFSRLNYKLAKLYGANLDASTEKFGDYQLLKMTISVINDRFSFDEESLVKSASDLLLNMVFEPNIQDDAFITEDLKREKRKAIEHIKGEMSDKRVYAQKRLAEEMYKNSAYGLPKCGTIEDVESITEQGLFEAWKKMLKEAFVRVQVVGAAVPVGLFEEVAERFNTVDRGNITDCKLSAPTSLANKVNTITERMDIAQGKLCLGFSSEMFGPDSVTIPLLVTCDMFGGGPYSKLFSNVREKMSLCYYCAARSIRIKGLVTVESGVETANCEKAEKEILNQLEALKKGDFSDFEFESSIKSIIQSLNSYNDSQNSLNSWYSIKVNDDCVYSPEEIAEKISKVSKEDIIATANGINLHTVYKLLPKEEK